MRLDRQVVTLSAGLLKVDHHRIRKATRHDRRGRLSQQGEQSTKAYIDHHFSPLYRFKKAEHEVFYLTAQHEPQEASVSSEMPTLYQGLLQDDMRRLLAIRAQQKELIKQLGDINLTN